MYEKKKKMLARLEDQLVKLEVQATDKVRHCSVCVCVCVRECACLPVLGDVCMYVFVRWVYVVWCVCV